MNDWKADLNNFLDQRDEQQQNKQGQIKQAESEAESFFSSKVIAAFEEVKAIFEGRGREVTISYGQEEASIKVAFQGSQELDYRVRVRIYPGRIVAYPVTGFSDKGRYCTGEGFFRSGSQDYAANDLTKDEILRHLLDQYKSSLSYPNPNR